MQVLILEYVVPRVLEYPCVKFVIVYMSKTSLIDILSSGSVLIEHIPDMSGPSRTYPASGPDMSGLLGLFHSVECQLLVGSS
jgi:hypothetical protein